MDEIYVVESILDRKLVNKNIQYLVKWVDTDAITWLPKRKLVERSGDLIEAFEAKWKQSPKNIKKLDQKKQNVSTNQKSYHDYSSSDSDNSDVSFVSADMERGEMRDVEEEIRRIKGIKKKIKHTAKATNNTNSIVREILDRRLYNKTLEYLVKWIDCEGSYWQRKSKLRKMQVAEKLIEQFERRRNEKLNKDKFKDDELRDEDADAEGDDNAVEDDFEDVLEEPTKESSLVVEKILDKRSVSRNVQYLVQWLGVKGKTWVRKSKLMGRGRGVIEEFERSRNQKCKTRKRTKIKRKARPLTSFKASKRSLSECREEKGGSSQSYSDCNGTLNAMEMLPDCDHKIQESFIVEHILDKRLLMKNVQYLVKFWKDDRPIWEWKKKLIKAGAEPDIIQFEKTLPNSDKVKGKDCGACTWQSKKKLLKMEDNMKIIEDYERGDTSGRSSVRMNEHL